MQYVELYPYQTHGEYHTMITAGGPVWLSAHRLFPSFWGKDGGVPQG